MSGYTDGKLTIDEVARLCGLSYDFCRNYIAFLSGRIRFLNERICELTDKTPERKLFRIFSDFSAPPPQIFGFSVNRNSAERLKQSLQIYLPLGLVGFDRDSP